MKNLFFSMIITIFSIPVFAQVQIPIAWGFRTIECDKDDGDFLNCDFNTAVPGEGAIKLSDMDSDPNRTENFGKLTVSTTVDGVEAIGEVSITDVSASNMPQNSTDMFITLWDKPNSHFTRASYSFHGMSNWQGVFMILSRPHKKGNKLVFTVFYSHPKNYTITPEQLQNKIRSLL